jgi:hypothetical protein
VGLRLQAATARARMRRGGGEVKERPTPPERGCPFIGSGGGGGGRNRWGGGGNWCLHGCSYWE